MTIFKAKRRLCLRPSWGRGGSVPGPHGEQGRLTAWHPPCLLGSQESSAECPVSTQWCQHPLLSNSPSSWAPVCLVRVNSV